MKELCIVYFNYLFSNIQYDCVAVKCNMYKTIGISTSPAHS